MIKKSETSASEESFKIFTGTEEVYASPAFENASLRELETCLPDTTNQQYTLTLYDSYGDSWGTGAYLELRSINGNQIFKTMMLEGSEVSYSLSLYNPIPAGSTWKFTNAASGEWKTVGFGDSTWSDVNTATGAASTGVQYFRKSFAGLAGMAAIDLELKYQHGIVAYIGGVEVYRDNMPAGVVTESTLSTGSYSTAEYHGVIRPSDVAEEQTVLAVEIHFQSASYEETTVFNGFLYFLAGMSANNNCFLYPYDVTVTSDKFDSASNPFSWTFNQYAYVESSELPAYLEVTFGSVIPTVNAIQMYPYIFTLASPSQLSIEGKPTGGVYTSMATFEGITYENQEWKLLQFSNTEKYASIKLTALAASDYYTQIFEIKFLVCNAVEPTTITYPQASYVFNSRFDDLNILSDASNLDSCTSSPALPNGLVLESSTCNIRGASTTSSAQTTYTITGMKGSNSRVGTITLTFNDCAGTMIHIVRTYKSSPSSESFRIRNTATDELLYEVAPGHSHPANQNWEHYLCVTADRFDVTLDSSSTTWAVGSYLYIYSRLPDDKQEIMLKAHFDSLQGNEASYYLRRHVIHDTEEWYYKMGDVPGTWFDDSTTGWDQKSRGAFPNSPNAIQLYKKQFTISNLAEVSGVILSIRYKFGCIVYLNGHEAWRNRVTGTLSTSSVASDSYSELLYRVVTLPGRLLNEGTTVDLLKQGTNTIAIAIVGINDQSVESLFDATVRLMSDQPESHIWEFTGSVANLIGSADNAFDMSSTTVIQGNNCNANRLYVTLDNDRREWISSVMIQNSITNDHNTKIVSYFNLYGRNSNSDGWTLIKNNYGLTYSMKGQRKKIYTYNNVPYNQFRFDDFTPNSYIQCDFIVQSLNLYTENVLASTTELTYPTPIIVYANVETAEIIPTSTGYSDFQSNPMLPSGLKLDAQSGWISGTARSVQAQQSYTITAKNPLGQSVSTVITLTVDVCTGGKGLMTVRISADGQPTENSWKLFAGRTTQGTPLQSVSQFPVSNNLYYLDFCMEDGLYTFEATDSFGDGWSINTGYTLTVDLGEMELEVQEVAPSSQTPVSVTTTFSTFFPFQVDFTDWKVYQNVNTPVTADWALPSFNDGEWQTLKAASIANTDAVTTYIRKSFELTNIDDYQVLNVRVKYAGGVVVYFNGNKMARFNLVADFNANTESIEVHDSALFSKFHIILATSGVKEGTNVVAFEVHRPVGTSSSVPFVFDATGVFGVETCSTVVDSFASISSPTLSSASLTAIMDLDPETVETMQMTVGETIDWTVENLEGSRWNSFNLLGSQSYSFGFAINAQVIIEDTESELTEIASVTSSELVSRTKPQVPVSVALAGFRTYRFEVTNAGAQNAVGSIHFAYCKASGDVCPGVDNYPSVTEGQISPAACPAEYTGYSYRVCSNGVLGEVNMEHCMPRIPTFARYPVSTIQLVKDVQASSGVPLHDNIVESFYMDQQTPLPAGLSINTLTGEITGVPTVESSLQMYTVYAENKSGVMSFTIAISVRIGMCQAEGLFQATPVGETAEYKCSERGAYIGTQKSACVLGEADGEWQKATGFCMSIAALVIVIVVVVLVIAVVVFLLVRHSRKAQSKGGVKNKKIKVDKSKKSGVKSKNMKVLVVCC